ncbi:unnamed protein product [Mytilus coruscus]|uniref:Uncharacterized protein n=1 Tax=Mytilus coruscus TaxID=42192 RepID=A0A6J8D4V7_MYTCO|nr:unnamed protein product [Mytilus coruscus]
MKENGKWWTADNRRLWIFRHLEKLQKCTEIPVNIIQRIDSRKRSSTNGGTDVSICRGRNPGGVWHSKVDSIKIPDIQNNKDIFTGQVVKHHANNQIGGIKDGTFSDKKILECNDQPIKPVDPYKGSPYGMIQPDRISSAFNHYLSMGFLDLDDMGKKMNDTPLKKSPFSHVCRNNPSINKTEFVVSSSVNSRNTLDVLPKRLSLHQSARYTPYKSISKFSRLGILKQTLACKTTSIKNTGNMCTDSNRSNFSKKVRLAKTDDPFVTSSIYQQYEKYYSFHPKENVYSYPKLNNYNYQDTGSDVEDEYEYCYEYESDISDDISDGLDEESSDDSNDDDSYESDDENSDISDNDRFNYSPKKSLSTAALRESCLSTSDFQHSSRESYDISYDSSDNSVDDFRCYDLTYQKEGHLYNGCDGENSCDFYDEENNPFKYWNMEDSTISNLDSSDDHYTAVLDRAYIAGCYNSDVDNMIYDYID